MSFQKGFEQEGGKKGGLNRQHIALTGAKTSKGTFNKHVEGNDKMGFVGMSFNGGCFVGTRI